MDRKDQEARRRAEAASREVNDWRVQRLMYCKDPQYNTVADPAHAYEIQQRKMADAEVLERQLGYEATQNWAKALSVAGQVPPPLECVQPKAIPFLEVQPNYQAEQDVWSQTLELRTLEEAMRGDLTKPLPRPAVHTEEYANFHEGKYVGDGCPIA